MLKKFTLSICVIAITVLGSAFTMPPDYMQKAQSGVEAIYNLDFKTAQENIDYILQKSPNYPIALFGKTMIEWARFEYEFEKSNPVQTEVFEKTILSSIDGIKNWLKNNEGVAQDYLALGGIYGVKARFDLANKRYIKAYFSGRKGIKYMNKAAKLSPEMYDAYLGEAIYQYYAGTLPAVVKVLAKLVASGNAQKGIDYLNLIKDKGKFSADTAKLLLVEISIHNEDYYNPQLAAKLIKEVRQKYPQNPLFEFVSIIADYENKNYDKVISSSEEFLSKIGKEPFYKEIYIARTYSAIGTAYMAQGLWEKAAQTFENSIKATASQEMSRWQMNNLLRLAEVYDILGQRQTAVKIYKDIKNAKESWGIDEVATIYLKKPYTAEDKIGHLSPP
jgi:tetratricopeptide (TPR) repeat protein